MIASGWRKYESLKEIMKSKVLSRTVIRTILNTSILLCITHGSKTLSLTQDHRNYQWIMKRSMLKIKLTNRMTSVEIWKIQSHWYTYPNGLIEMATEKSHATLQDIKMKQRGNTLVPRRWKWTAGTINKKRRRWISLRLRTLLDKSIHRQSATETLGGGPCIKKAHRTEVNFIIITQQSKHKLVLGVLELQASFLP